MPLGFLFPLSWVRLLISYIPHPIFSCVSHFHGSISPLASWGSRVLYPHNWLIIEPGSLLSWGWRLGTLKMAGQPLPWLLRRRLLSFGHCDSCLLFFILTNFPMHRLGYAFRSCGPFKFRNSFSLKSFPGWCVSFVFLQVPVTWTLNDPYASLASLAPIAFIGLAVGMVYYRLLMVCRRIWNSLVFLFPTKLLISSEMVPTARSISCAF